MTHEFIGERGKVFLNASVAMIHMIEACFPKTLNAAFVFIGGFQPYQIRIVAMNGSSLLFYSITRTR